MGVELSEAKVVEERVGTGGMLTQSGGYHVYPLHPSFPIFSGKTKEILISKIKRSNENLTEKKTQKLQTFDPTLVGDGGSCLHPLCLLLFLMRTHNVQKLSL